MVANANPAGCDGGAAEVDHAAELITSRHKSPTSRTQADLIPRRKLEAIRALNSERGALDLIDDILAEHPAPLESPNTAALNSIYRLAVLDEKLPRRKLPTFPPSRQRRIGYLPCPAIGRWQAMASSGYCRRAVGGKIKPAGVPSASSAPMRSPSPAACGRGAFRAPTRQRCWNACPRRSMNGPGRALNPSHSP